VEVSSKLNVLEYERIKGKLIVLDRLPYDTVNAKEGAISDEPHQKAVYQGLIYKPSDMT